MALSLDKLEKDLAGKDGELLSLAKKTKLSLEKNQLNGVEAKVAVCLDISYSMSNLYSSGAISQLVKKLIPLGISFDDDGEIDVFTFGEKGGQQESINLGNYIPRLDSLKNIKLEGATNYSEAISLVDSHYSSEPDVKDVPVYVIFITDGDASDRSKAEAAMKRISKYPIFFQFVALGEDYTPDNTAKTPEPEEPKKGFFGRLFGGDSTSQSSRPNTRRSQFQFLIDLDDMSGRVVDNAGFFAIKTPDSKEPSELYDLMMGEFPDFLTEAKRVGVLN